MTPRETESPRRSLIAKLAVGSLIAAGLLAAAIVPASADDDDDWGYGNGYGHHKHKHKRCNRPYEYSEGYYYAPQPPVVYYQPAPVYYAPPPPPVYYQPAPVVVYPRRPSISIVFPINID